MEAVEEAPDVVVVGIECCSLRQLPLVHTGAAHVVANTTQKVTISCPLNG